MKINDRLYGQEEINEEVLVELILTKEVQRLKGISQQGMPRRLWFSDVFSRYEHSIGVLIILRRMGAEIEEQIAGLLHDISHTAFSHVVDWVFGDPEKEDYQDNSHLDILGKGEVNQILKKYQFDFKKIAKLEKYSLLDNEIPNLCADRLDYSLREMIKFESKENINFIINSLDNIDGRIVFNNIDAANIFSEGFAICQRNYWAAPEPRLRYFILSSVLSEAVKIGLIKEEDFMKEDEDIIKLLEKKGNDFIKQNLEKLKERISFKEANGGIRLVKKFRYVDPLVFNKGVLKRLSEISLNYKKSLEKQREEANKVLEAVII